jgi:[ribosomal protein S18]-alanine N-acetyltransferase
MLTQGKTVTRGKTELGVHIRWMIRRDMPEVLRIETNSFEFPWCEDDFIRCLRQRNCIGMVAEYDERVVGFMIYELHKNRLHILNFAVLSEFRRRGVGQAMVRKLVGKLSQQRRNRIMLEIRETNLAAQLFFRDAGFRAISVLRDFYDDTIEDAYLMQYRFNPADEVREYAEPQITRMAG